MTARAARLLTGVVLASCVLLGACSSGTESGVPTATPSASPGVALVLPPPEMPVGEDASLLTLLDERHSTRAFSTRALDLGDVSTLLWAGYGLRSDGGRTVPSAGALYPLTLYLVSGQVSGLDAGVWVYRPATARLEQRLPGDRRRALAGAALGQESVERATAVLVVAGDPEHLRERYGDRSERFELLEAGHVGQNIALTAQALGPGVVTIGSFGDGDVADVLDLPEGEHVHYLLPVGHP